MRSLLIVIITLCTITIQAQIQHNLVVEIKPSQSFIHVEDEISFSEGNEAIFFSLNSIFTPKMLSKGLALKAVAKDLPASDIGMDHDDADSESSLKITKWQIVITDRNLIEKSIKISYEGVIASALEQSEKNYQRGFSESPGIIAEKGIYLAGSTYWVPIFGNEMMTYTLDVNLPKGWKSVSQGKRTIEEIENDQHFDKWICDKPQEEVFLIGAKFSEYSFDAGNVKAMAFLRTPDEGLANKYLETTAQYLEMYRNILGLYPYSKFALVENFWETGYGMPSFTLLGERIIRFPFILHSSYPHELLHNWWGNSVYVDFESGNWCEGLTAYMADHLIKEQRGRGMNYRRSTLQKFSDLVNEKTDFPLVDFRSRYDGPSEAIGYGKSLMMWHMLRRKYGDDLFLLAMRRFYKKNRYKRASFDDIRLAFESVIDADLKPFFTQWLTRKGAPELVIDKIGKGNTNEGYQSVIYLKQVQKSPVFLLDIPVKVVTKNGVEDHLLTMNQKDQVFEVTTAEAPLKIMIDPMFDIFRILDPKEVSPGLTKAYGSDKTLIVLPKDAKDGSIYDQFAKSWVKNEPSKFKIIKDNEISKYPVDQTVWILGYENAFMASVQKDMDIYNAKISRDSVKFPNQVVLKKGNDVIITLAHPDNEKEAIVFIAIGDEAAIPGLVRKLPHYGKYSYLAFEGTEPTNIAKGQWPVIQSPLIKDLVENVPSVEQEKRDALAYLEPVFSSKDMMTDIEYLASEKMKGRGLGTPELDVAAQYIVESFKSSGLLPAGDGNSFLQQWTADVLDKKALKMANVVGVIPGINPDLKDQPVVISAHYDHLGMGWPDAHDGDEGKIHLGADDNASGVAVMLELAKRVGKTAKPQRPIIFIAFTGEEAGLVGSRYFVKSRNNHFFANINLDTEGSLFDQKLIILNANTASEWKHIFMGTDYVTGVATHLVMNELDASDQGAFIEKGIPAVQFFAGATTNYHRPSDTADKIDAAGLVKVATVAKEVLLYLGDRDRPMPFTGNAKQIKPKTHHPSDGKRSASTGAVPSFSYEGKGVKIGDVPKDTPADKAGLKTGDIIIEMADTVVDDLRGYSQLLKKLEPGNKVKVKVLRNGETILVDLTLKAR